MCTPEIKANQATTVEIDGLPYNRLDTQIEFHQDDPHLSEQAKEWLIKEGLEHLIPQYETGLKNIQQLITHANTMTEDTAQNALSDLRFPIPISDTPKVKTAIVKRTFQRVTSTNGKVGIHGSILHGRSPYETDIDFCIQPIDQRISIDLMVREIGGRAELVMTCAGQYDPLNTEDQSSVFALWVKTEEEDVGRLHRLLNVIKPITPIARTSQIKIADFVKSYPLESSLLDDPIFRVSQQGEVKDLLIFQFDNDCNIIGMQLVILHSQSKFEFPMVRLRPNYEPKLRSLGLEIAMKAIFEAHDQTNIINLNQLAQEELLNSLIQIIELAPMNPCIQPQYNPGHFPYEPYHKCDETMNIDELITDQAYKSYTLDILLLLQELVWLPREDDTPRKLKLRLKLAETLVEVLKLNVLVEKSFPQREQSQSLSLLEQYNNYRTNDGNDIRLQHQFIESDYPILNPHFLYFLEQYMTPTIRHNKYGNGRPSFPPSTVNNPFIWTGKYKISPPLRTGPYFWGPYMMRMEMW